MERWKELAQIYLDQNHNFLLTQKSFWTVKENKMKFQQFFSDLRTKNYSESIPLYLGGSGNSGKIILGEKFLVECISKSSERNNFDDIHFERYHQKSFQLD